jgi:hypothetical protein
LPSHESSRAGAARLSGARREPGVRVTVLAPVMRRSGPRPTTATSFRPTAGRRGPVLVPATTGLRATPVFTPRPRFPSTGRIETVTGQSARREPGGRRVRCLPPPTGGRSSAQTSVSATTTVDPTAAPAAPTHDLERR